MENCFRATNHVPDISAILLEFADGQINQLGCSIIGRERTACLDRFTDRPVQALDGVRGRYADPGADVRPCFLDRGICCEHPGQRHREHGCGLWRPVERPWQSDSDHGFCRAKQGIIRPCQVAHSSTCPPGPARSQRGSRPQFTPLAIHPRPDAAPEVFERSAVRPPPFYGREHEKVRPVTRAMRARQAGTGFLGESEVNGWS